MGQSWGIKVATKSLTRQRLLAPGEAVLAYAVADNQQPPFGRLDVVLTTEAVFIGPNVQHTNRFALDDVVLWDFTSGFHFATAEGYRIDLVLRGSVELPQMMGRQLGNRARAAVPPPPPFPPASRPSPSSPGHLQTAVAVLGWQLSPDHQVEVFQESNAAIWAVNDECMTLELVDSFALFDSRCDRLSSVSWWEGVEEFGAPTLMALEFGYMPSGKTAETHVAILLGAMGLFAPTETDRFLRHPTAERFIDPLLAKWSNERPSDAKVLPLLNLP